MKNLLLILLTDCSVCYLEQPVYFKVIFYKIIDSGTGNHRLDVMNALQKIPLPSAVKLGKHIVKQQHRCILYALLYDLNLRKLQRQCRRPLLSLGTEPPDVHFADRKTEIVAVGTAVRHFGTDIALPVLL